MTPACGNKNRKQSGFTLVEMSLVLVVIGLLVSVIVYGQSLKEKSDWKAVLSEMSTYLSAAQTFRTKYHYRPGDVPDAGMYFTGNADVDGNGNGEWDTATERDILWNQLSQSGMIEQTIDAAAAAASTPGVNRPTSKFASGTGWTFMDTLDLDPPGAVTSIKYYNLLRIGGSNSDENLTRTTVPVKAHLYIDNKIDIPNTPFSGIYIAGEASCGTESGGVYSYTTTLSTKCTGNFLENSTNEGSYTP